MKTLRDLTIEFPHILDVPVELLETINFNEIARDKDSYIFVDATYLVDLFIQRIEWHQITSIKFEGQKVLFIKNKDKIVIHDEYNNCNIEIDITDKLKLLHNLLYYFNKMEEWEEIYKGMKISLRDYNILKNKI